MVRYSNRVLPSLAAVLLATVSTVSAQDLRVGSAGAPTSTELPAGGWNLTPSLLYGASWDSNVLLKGRGDDTRADLLNVMNPRGDAEFVGRRGQLSASYDGAFLIYRELNTLDSYDQHASVSARRSLSKHVTMFANDMLAITPTTELSLLIGIPFLRTGARVNDLRTGIEADLTKRTSITASYHFDWVRFDPVPTFSQLLGGESHGGLLFLRHKLSDLTALTVEYDRQFSSVGRSETFDIENTAAGFERKLTVAMRIYAAGGISHLGESSLAPAHTSPRYHAGLAYQIRKGTLDVIYDRSFAPSFGFAGTTDSKEFSVRVYMPLDRKVYTRSAVSWRTNSYLQAVDTSLDSRWFEASIGYLTQPWMRVEGFYASALQTTTLPGGTLDRNRFGVQVITAKPVRIR